MHKFVYATLPRNTASIHQSKPTLNNLACFLNDQTTILNYIESQPCKKTGTKTNKERNKSKNKYLTQETFEA